MPSILLSERHRYRVWRALAFAEAHIEVAKAFTAEARVHVDRARESLAAGRA